MVLEKVEGKPETCTIFYNDMQLEIVAKFEPR